MQKIYIAIAFQLCLCSFAKSQNAWDKKHKLQANYGLTMTLHYNKPVNLFGIFEEAPFPVEQDARLSNNFGINYYRSINPNNEIEIGLGLSQYSFDEGGYYTPGGGEYLPYKFTVDFDYLDISIGHRYAFSMARKIRPYLENNLMYELLFKKNNAYDTNFKIGGIAVKFMAGVRIDISNYAYLNAQTAFKSGVIRYNKNRNHLDSYIPYGYGVEIGVGIKF